MLKKYYRKVWSYLFRKSYAYTLRKKGHVSLCIGKADKNVGNAIQIESYVA